MKLRTLWSAKVLPYVVLTLKTYIYQSADRTISEINQRIVQSQKEIKEINSKEYNTLSRSDSSRHPKHNVVWEGSIYILTRVCFCDYYKKAHCFRIVNC